MSCIPAEYTPILLGKRHKVSLASLTGLALTRGAARELIESARGAGGADGGSALLGGPCFH